MPLLMQRNQPTGGGVIDLYSPYMQQQQEAQAQKQADWQGIMNAIQQIARYKAEQDFMKQQGISRQEPVMGTFDQSMLNKYQGNLGQFSPEAQAQLRQAAQEKITIPTGKTRTAYDFSKIPYGMEMAIPGTGFMAKGMRQGIQQVPEGFEVAGYSAEGQAYVRKVKEEKESYAENKRKALLGAVGRIESGEGDLRTEMVNLQRSFPDVSLDTLANLQEISKAIKKKPPKKQENETTRAIQMLRKKGYSEKEAKEYLGL